MERQKSNNQWIIESCENIYTGRYSECVKNGLYVRKYYKYDNPQRFIEEYKTMNAAYKIGLLVPKPIKFEYDECYKKWFLESEYVECKK